MDKQNAQTQSAASPDKLYFIDGIRGTAAIFVLLFHVFSCMIHPAWLPSYNEVVFLDGPTSVLIFFVLSGFSLSIAPLRKINGNNDDKLLGYSYLEILPGKVLGIYCRLAIPAFFACFLVYLLIKLGLSYYKDLPESSKIEWWAWAYSNLDISFVKLLRFSLYDIFFQHPFIPISPYGGVYFITNLWTMSVEFFGSLLVYFFMVIFSFKRCRLLCYTMGIVFFLFFNSYFFILLLG